MKISVGICAYNEGANIDKLLDNLINQQDLPEESEIIVVASGCTDNTCETVKKFSERDRRVKLLIEWERIGKASAINKILNTYTGDFLIFLPADVQPKRGSLKELLKGFTDHIGIVAARPVPLNIKPTVLDSVVRLVWHLHHGTLEYLNHHGALKHASGEMFAMRRGVMNTIPEVVNDDAYIALYTIQQGFLIKYNPKAVVLMKGPETLSDYLTQRRRVVFGHYQLKKSTGRFPSVLGFMFPSKLRTLIHILARETIDHQKLVPLIVAFFLELSAHLLAIIDSILGKSHLKWKAASTTKRL